MSYADQVFRANCLDILQNGVRDDDLTVRPHWEDGTPAHTIKKLLLFTKIVKPLTTCSVLELD
jgi:thymidylate synthase